MNKDFFKQCQNIEQLKREYRKLAMEHHPDKPNGNSELMKVINNQYEFYFNKLKNIHEDEEGSSQESKTENNENMYEYINIINELINFENINISIVGSWIWIAGDTKPIKEKLKELKFFWNSKRAVWQHKPEDEEYKKSYSKESSDQIKSKYGCTKIKTKQRLTLT